MADNEKELKEKAIAYLKTAYGEDTVSMDVKNNGVEGGNGILKVECTVSIGGRHSDWYKEFHFKGGKVIRMTWKMR